MKYELIKEYPGSPKLEYVSIPKTEENKKTNNHYYSGSWFDPSLYPEFWKKLEEVDYLILDYKEISIRPTGPFKNSELTISSVKRLSDGEVFALNEYVIVPYLGEEHGCNILRFFINEGKMTILTTMGSSIEIPITVLKKRKTPLFTTEDGVEIFEGQSYVYTPKVTMKYINVSDGNSIPMPKESFFYFSTKEKAVNYAELNKPCLSLNDLLSVWGGEYPETSPLFRSFEQIVKSKL